MHICFTGQYPFKNQSAGGVGTFTQTLAEALAKKQVIVSVIAFYPGAHEITEIQNGVTIYWLNNNKWRLWNFIRLANKTNQLIQKIHRKQTIDIVETQEAGLAFLNPVPGIRFIIRLHGGHYFFSRTLGKPFSRIKASHEKKSFAKAAAFIGVSHFVLQETAKHLSFDLSKAVVIPNPVDCNRFYASMLSKAVSGRIVFVGRLVEKKGIRQLIQAMPTVIAQYPQVELHVYGGDTTIDEGHSFLEVLQKQIPAELKNQIHFFGEVKNELLPAILEQAQLCVYPSHMEAMPIAWLEVMAMGKPFIAGRPGPGQEVIDDGINGLLCDPYSPEDIAIKILWMLEHQPEANEMGKAARMKIMEQFSLEIITKRNLDFFEELLKWP